MSVCGTKMFVDNHFRLVVILCVFFGLSEGLNSLDDVSAQNELDRPSECFSFSKILIPNFAHTQGFVIKVEYVGGNRKSINRTLIRNLEKIWTFFIFLHCFKEVLTCYYLQMGPLPKKYSIFSFW